MEKKHNLHVPALYMEYNIKKTSKMNIKNIISSQSPLRCCSIDQKDVQSSTPNNLYKWIENIALSGIHDVRQMRPREGRI